MDNARLVVVIPTKNRRAMLERALQSVLAQEYGVWRAVVVNDGSTDDTQTYLDSLKDARIMVIHKSESRGVNAARNVAYRTLGPDEWAVPLDDDDMLLPGALRKIANAIEEAGSAISILSFSSIIQTPQGERLGGREIGNEPWHDLSYEEMMTRWGGRGDGHTILSGSLFPKYLFPEDVNGFESEIQMLRARDGVRIRYYPIQTLLIDRSHEAGHLNKTAAHRDPASFVRVHERMFRDHAPFFASHPQLARQNALAAFKLAVRAWNPIAAVKFWLVYVRAGAAAARRV